ncbi:vegetative cell wall protein gp1-like isoform X2 [Triticum dicoccoides]|uniref:vegetative cell wall protein gp1-like isoform X2 n=1 Tax=Triticum dicoccoides TaxID=85692 RepID=UPI001890A698|nr:vegetative cell wall protein gp1-like isoform X2 [Triticum dicoccoides]
MASWRTPAPPSPYLTSPASLPRSPPSPSTNHSLPHSLSLSPKRLWRRGTVDPAASIHPAPHGDVPEDHRRRPRRLRPSAQAEALSINGIEPSFNLCRRSSSSEPPLKHRPVHPERAPTSPAPENTSRGSIVVVFFNLDKGVELGGPVRPLTPSSSSHTPSSVARCRCSRPSPTSSSSPTASTCWSPEA